jgi:hypothetical protein
MRGNLPEIVPPAGREEALVAAARTVLWALRDPLNDSRLSIFSIAALLLLEEALEFYEDRPAITG